MAWLLLKQLLFLLQFVGPKGHLLAVLVPIKNAVKSLMSLRFEYRQFLTCVAMYGMMTLDSVKNYSDIYRFEVFVFIYVDFDHFVIK